VSVPATKRKLLVAQPSALRNLAGMNFSDILSTVSCSFVFVGKKHRYYKEKHRSFITR
jgi:hypothetical protein